MTRPEMSGVGAMALVGQVGLMIALPIVAGVWIGKALDTRFNTGGLLIAVGVLVGVAAGLVAAGARLVKESKWKR